MGLKDAPSKLQPYLFHGVQLDYSGNREPTGTCPFCDRENKFHVSAETGQYHCKLSSCEASGNVYQFIQTLHERSVEEREEAWLSELADKRGVSEEILDLWGVAPSYLTGEVIVPAYNIKGKMTNLYQWLKNRDSGKMILYSTPTLKHGLFGMSNWDSSRKSVAIAEGPWSGAAAHQLLQGVMAKGDVLEGGKILPMFKRENSLGETEFNVVGIPGCNNFRDVWTELFAGLDVAIMLDNDHPGKDKNKGLAGWKGTVRTARLLLESNNPPNRVYGMKWGEEFHNPDLKNGYDVRDALIEHSVNGDGITRLKPPIAASKALKSLLGYLTPLGKTDVTSDSNGSNGSAPKKKGESRDLIPVQCETLKEVRIAWIKAFKWTPQLNQTLVFMLSVASSTSLPGSAQLWGRVYGPPGSGKSTLCEALSVSRKYTFANSVQRGFHSGSKDKETGESCSLVPDIDGKTVIIKDGDTLLNGPNRDQSLAELRDLYDGTSRARYRNSKTGQNYTGLRITFLLAGTKSLKRMNRSFLGDRFLDCVIYEKGDNPELEDNILKRAAFNALRQMKMDDVSIDSINDERMINAMELTAGYLHYLREHIETLANEVTVSSEILEECISLGEFTSYMRARPDKELEEEDDEVELPTRLTQQYVRLATCAAVVMNKQEVDEEVMKLVHKIAYDTSRGITFSIVQQLAKYPQGVEPKTLAMLTHKLTQKVNTVCRFLMGIGVVHRHKEEKTQMRWKLDDHIRHLVSIVNK